MDVILILFALSAALGCATGLRFNVFAMAAVSMLIALGSAIVLRAYGFSATGGILVVAACLLTSQIAYISSVFFESGAETLADDISGDAPDNDREGNVSNGENGQNRCPPWPPSTPDP